MDDRDLGHNSCCSLLTACKSLVSISQHSGRGNLVKSLSYQDYFHFKISCHVKIIFFAIIPYKTMLS